MKKKKKRVPKEGSKLMDYNAVEKLFVEALKDLCKMNGPNTNLRFPFNISKISIRMTTLSEEEFHITNSPFQRFSELVEQMSDAGHVVHAYERVNNNATCKAQLVISDTK